MIQIKIETEIGHAISPFVRPPLCYKNKQSMSGSEKIEKVHIDDLHFEHKRWLSELKFYKDELPIFQNRLEEIASRYTNKDVLKEMDHYQNQLYIQGNAMDELIHEINAHEKHLAQYAEEHPIAIDHVLFNDHAPFRDRVETNGKIMGELRKDFQAYLAKWM